jgi:hypothetical protein
MDSFNITKGPAVPHFYRISYLIIRHGVMRQATPAVPLPVDERKERALHVWGRVSYNPSVFFFCPEGVPATEMHALINLAQEAVEK